jgi:hypothetical protein
MLLSLKNDVEKVCSFSHLLRHVETLYTYTHAHTGVSLHACLYTQLSSSQMDILLIVVETKTAVTNIKSIFLPLDWTDVVQSMAGALQIILYIFRMPLKTTQPHTQSSVHLVKRLATDVYLSYKCFTFRNVPYQI